MKRDIVEVIVSRKTKGWAFNPPAEGYHVARDRIRLEVQKDFDTMSEEDFSQKYKDWTYK